MSTVVSLDRSLQYLIDVRLDTLDRILIDSGVSRSKRSEIVQAVEAQIFEKLDQQGGAVSRTGVLQLLGSLDPPEAYCSEEARIGILERPISTRRRVALDVPPAQWEQWQCEQGQCVTPTRHSGLAITSFVLAILSIPTIIIIPFGSILALGSLIFGIFALQAIAASHGRLRGRWMAIFGCATFALHVVITACVLLMAMSS